jgi:tRNA pseudouridine55 synthase
MEKKTGFIIINKPEGPTSHDVVNKLRRITGIKKIGHAGTLDPFASGVLVCAIGREATRDISKIQKTDKEYRAEVFLGAQTDTYDKTGKAVKKPPLLVKKAGGSSFWRLKKTINALSSLFSSRRKDYDRPSSQKIEKTLEKFKGKQKQIPPMYSAKKIGGKKLYELARQGKEVKRRPAIVYIYDIRILKYDFPKLKLDIRCSSGTYIRSLAHDIGVKLGCGAYLESLKRTAVGKFKIEDAIDVEKINKGNWGKFLIKNQKRS